MKIYYYYLDRRYLIWSHTVKVGRYYINFELNNILRRIIKDIWITHYNHIRITQCWVNVYCIGIVFNYIKPTRISILVSSMGRTEFCCAQISSYFNPKNFTTYSVVTNCSAAFLITGQYWCWRKRNNRNAFICLFGLKFYFREVIISIYNNQDYFNSPQHEQFLPLHLPPDTISLTFRLVPQLLLGLQLALTKICTEDILS